MKAIIDKEVKDMHAMGLKAYWQHICKDQHLQFYLEKHVMGASINLKKGDTYKMKPEEILLVKKGVCFQSLTNKNSHRYYQIIGKGDFALFAGSSLTSSLEVLENTKIKTFPLEDTFLFLEQEQLANIFWLELIDQQQFQYEAIHLSSYKRLYCQLKSICVNYGEALSAEEVILPAWFTVKKLSALSYTAYSNSVRFFQNLKMKQVIRKEKDTWFIKCDFLI